MSELPRFALAILWSIAVLGPAVLEERPQCEQVWSLRGVVISAVDGTSPISGAVVTIAGKQFKSPVSAVSDSEGLFRFEQIAEGDVRVIAHKAGYLPMAYGAIRPGSDGVAVPVGSSAAPEELVIPLTLASTVTGTVYDSLGQAVPDVQVSAVRQRSAGSFEATIAATRTDASGRYCLSELWPGRYLVAVTLRGLSFSAIQSRTTAENDAIFAALEKRMAAPSNGYSTDSYIPDLMTVYYPRVLDEGASPLVSVGSSSSYEQTDITLPRIPAVRVAGQVQLPGQVRGGTVMLTTLGTSTVLAPPPRFAPVDQRGSFAFEAVPSGTYELDFRSERATVTTQWWARQTISVGQQPVSGLVLVTRPGMELRGEVVNLLELSGLTLEVNLSDAKAESAARIAAGAGTLIAPFENRTRIRGDGSFNITGVAPGTYKLNVSSLREDVAMLSALAGGQDLLDVPLEIKAETTELPPIRILISRAMASLGGTIATPQGTPISRYTVLLLPVSRDLWTSPGRRIRTTLPDSQGQYSFANVLPGSYYVGLLSQFEPADLENVDFLSAVAGAASVATISLGQHATVDLRMGTRDGIAN